MAKADWYMCKHSSDFSRSTCLDTFSVVPASEHLSINAPAVLTQMCLFNLSTSHAYIYILLHPCKHTYIAQNRRLAHQQCTVYASFPINGRLSNSWRIYYSILEPSRRQEFKMADKRRDVIVIGAGLSGKTSISSCFKQDHVILPCMFDERKVFNFLFSTILCYF